MEKISKSIRTFIRLVLFLILVTGFLAVGLFVHLTTKDPWERRRKFSRNTTLVCRIFLYFLNFKVKPINMPKHENGFLYVGNHLGILDILALASTKPFLFVTSVEMRETPFLGLLTEMAGCLYVERRKRGNIRSELAQMTEALKRGYRLVIYPEATSHNGEHVLPFKRTLVTSATLAGVPIVPGVFNFHRINQDGFIYKWRDHVCWYGDMSFLEALPKVLSLDGIEASIEFLPEVHADTEVHKSKLAEVLHEMVSSRFKPVEGPISL